MASQPGIVLYRDNYQNVRGVLTQSQKGDLLDALMDGEYQGGDQLVTMAYNIFAAAIRRTDEKYQAIRAKNQEAARIRWPPRPGDERLQFGRLSGIMKIRRAVCSRQDANEI